MSGPAGASGAKKELAITFNPHGLGLIPIKTGVYFITVMRDTY
jgi:hypothetical protein